MKIMCYLQFRVGMMYAGSLKQSSISQNRGFLVAYVHMQPLASDRLTIVEQLQLTDAEMTEIERVPIQGT